jgi:hypothetical protein
MATNTEQPELPDLLPKEHKPRTRGLKTALAIVGGDVILGAVGCGTQTASTSHKAAPQPTVTKIVTEAPKAKATPIVVRPKIVVTVPPAQAPAAPAPASQLRDIGGGIYAGPNTSDAFARNVVAAWDGVPGVKYVYSPVTGQTYAITYQYLGAGDVVATGGNGAYVQF